MKDFFYSLFGLLLIAVTSYFVWTGLTALAVFLEGEIGIWWTGLIVMAVFSIDGIIKDRQQRRRLKVSLERALTLAKKKGR